MLIGAMNDPSKPLADELVRIAASGFDFADITLEPPGAWPVDASALADILARTGLRGVGHTPYYLPIAAPFPEVREAALGVLEAMIEIFGRAGVPLVNLHPGTAPRLVPASDVRRWNVAATARLAGRAQALGTRLMVENLPVGYADVADIEPLLTAAPTAGFHLDVGHANIVPPGRANRISALLAAFGDRLVHVHVHDNFGRQDLHLPLGAGTTDWSMVVAALKSARWDGTVTLEIFSPEPELLLQARDRWRTWWQRPGLSDGPAN